MHAEVPVKVNVWVDAGVAPLVAALNTFPFIRTLDSCQGGHGRDAYCYFGHVGDGLSAFVDQLETELGAEASVTLASGTQHPVAVIAVPPDRLIRLSHHLEQVAKCYPNCPSADGRSDKELRS